MRIASFRTDLAGLAILAAASAVFADIPAGYKGTPSLGTPRALPGRIDFEDYDLGGVNVACQRGRPEGSGTEAGFTSIGAPPSREIRRTGTGAGRLPR